MPNPGEVRRVIEPVMEELGLDLIRLDFAPTRGHAHLRLVIDRTVGLVSVEDCTRASGAVGRLLDGLDLIPCRYRLEVSSPGVDRPLLTPRDYLRFEGSRVRVSLRLGTAEAEGPRRSWTGILKAYDATADALALDTDEGEVLIPRSQVAQARLDPELLAPARPPRRGRP